MVMVNMYQYQCWTSISDHSAFVIRSKPLVDAGPGQWRFPEDLLDDRSVLANIRTAIGCFEDINDPQQSWEAIKLNVKNIC